MQMGFAIQVGLVAAFVVVFLPLGMAGLHLTRNRLLFFSVGLFITLAVSVHIAPYFPSAYILFSPLMSNHNTIEVGQSTCISRLHEITWEDENLAINDYEEDIGPNRNSTKSCTGRRVWSWNENALAICGFQSLNQTDALQFLKGSWIMVAGDSQARLFILSLMDRLFSSSEFVREELFKRHSNYSFQKHQIKLDFVWAPYVGDLTNMIVNLRHSQDYPDVLIMADGLWHMLHVTNASDYLLSLVDLRKAVDSLFPTLSYFSFLPSGSRRGASISRVPQMFWINVPDLLNSKLNTEEKRLKLTNQICTEYDSELISSKILKPEGPLGLLDLYHLSKGCGNRCTMDGMHYCDMVYEALVQVMLNELLIATQQAPSK